MRANHLSDEISRECKKKKNRMPFACQSFYRTPLKWQWPEEEEKRNRNLISFFVFFHVCYFWAASPSSSSSSFSVRSKPNSNGLLITWHRPANVYNYADHSLGVFAQLIVKCVNNFVYTRTCLWLFVTLRVPEVYNNIHFGFYFCSKTAPTTDLHVP